MDVRLSQDEWAEPATESAPPDTPEPEPTPEETQPAAPLNIQSAETSKPTDAPPPSDAEENAATPAALEDLEAVGTATAETREPTDAPPPSDAEENAETPEALVAALERQVAQLQHQKLALQEEITQLQASRADLMQGQLADTQAAMGRLVKDALSELEQRKHHLQISVEQLERRQERIRSEMRTTFAGVSQDLAIRVQGFKDYLSGSLQDLVNAVEQLELTPEEPEPQRPPAKPTRGGDRRGDRRGDRLVMPKFAEGGFQDQAKHIRRMLDKYRTMPDYYGPAWQLRRTFEPVHAQRLSQWFFTQGGRGAIRTMGSRLQNILVTSAAISALKTLYGDRLRTLLLANTPERLGEWRRGLQDCLGISRIDFGPDRGVVLFEAPEAVAQKADRLLKQKQMPLIVIDETENEVNLSLLQFPLWLAFAPDPEVPTVL
ncbi:DUF3086 domain-containing protein [Phormidium sp. CCY1219]|nr:DUF3086 domain-containing protein [Phormidium sp. CCY1219]